MKVAARVGVPEMDRRDAQDDARPTSWSAALYAQPGRWEPTRAASARIPLRPHRPATSRIRGMVA